VSLRRQRGPISRCAKRNAAAFTLIDVLVTSAVIAILIGILLPSLSGAQENARRLVCRSNVRQIGLGMVMYADDHNGRLPTSQFIAESRMSRGPIVAQPQNLLTLRLAESARENALTQSAGGLDGIGLLYDTYLSSPKIYFCPSHRGMYNYSAMADAWNDPSLEVVGNYHYRGLGPAGRVSGTDDQQRFTPYLYDIDPARSSLLADGMREVTDYNHRDGLNYFRADLTAQWFSDHENQMKDCLAPDKDSATDSGRTNRAWQLIDAASEPK
jgi:type II secretory pathway pseudopilin PulG